MISDVICKEPSIYQELNDNEVNTRYKKLLKIRKNGVAFPNDFRRKFLCKQLHEKYGHKTNAELTELKVVVSIAGRLMNHRFMGKVSFFDLQDSTGNMQLYISFDTLRDNFYKKNIKLWDIGDILGICGILFKTRTGELTINCSKIRLLTKSLRPLPDKFHGLNDKEIKYRKRYLDLIVDNQAREKFKLRSLIISEIRLFMTKNHFIEVETPMMHTIAGGAAARPFITHHNKLGMDVYLRVAPELYLKQLIVGGFERIFEINRNFRNEGISPYHNPEFTMMEIYMAYADYHDMIVFVQDLLVFITKRVLNTNIVRYGDYSLDFKNPFIKMTIKESILYYCTEVQSQNIDNKKFMISFAQSLGIILDNNWTLNQIYMKIFEKIVEKKIIQPTCITNYPIEISPLARCNDYDPMIADRFELFIAGQEIGNGFSELNDPEDQRKRFIEQDLEKNFDDKKISSYDKDYLTALEYGLPPTAGFGVGIDRLIMLLTNQNNIRDVILFPMLRPKEE